MGFFEADKSLAHAEAAQEIDEDAGSEDSVDFLHA